MTNPEISALAVRGNPSNNNDHRPKKGQPWCDHCRRPGHAKDTWWKIHSKPAYWKPSQFANDKEGRGNLVSMDEKPSPEPTPFSKEQIEVLQKLFSQSLPAPTPTMVRTGSLAQKGNFLSALNVKKEKLSPWIIDSGASDHMTGDEKFFSTYNPCYKNLTVRIADGSLSKVAGTGSVRVSKNITLDSVLLVPKLNCNLLSISKLTRDLNCVTKFGLNLCEFQVLDSRKTIGNAKMCSGLYLLEVNDPPQGSTHHSDCSVSSSPISLSVSQSNNDSAVMLWHYRLGHPNFLYLEKLFPSLFHNKNPNEFQCEICQFSKHIRNSYPNRSYKASQPFSMIHSDVWGPSRIKNVTGSRWFISFIDDHTRLTWVFLMKEKSEANQIFKTFNTMIQTQFQAKIQILKSDNAKEYFNSILNDYLLSHGIVHQSSCVNTPQQNGIAERKNRHLLDVARSLMFSTHVPKFFWGEAILIAAYLINRMPSRILDF